MSIAPVFVLFARQRANGAGGFPATLPASMWLGRSGGETGAPTPSAETSAGTALRIVVDDDSIMVMRRTCLEFALYGVVPIVIVAGCMVGLVGGIIDGEALSPGFALGLILSTTVLGFYGAVLIFRAIRWSVAKLRRRWTPAVR